MKTDNKIILNDLAGILRRKYTTSLKDIVMFGSHVYGKSTKDSDYDILVVLNCKTDWKIERDISDLCYEIDLKYSIITDTHVISESELHELRGKQPIFANALINGLHS